MFEFKWVNSCIVVLSVPAYFLFFSASFLLNLSLYVTETMFNVNTAPLAQTGAHLMKELTNEVQLFES